MVHWQGVGSRSGRRNGPVHGAKRVAVVTDRITKNGDPKLVQRRTLLLAGVACVTRVYTSLAVVDIEAAGFILREKHPLLSFEDLQALTGAELMIENTVTDLIVPDL